MSGSQRHGQTRVPEATSRLQRLVDVIGALSVGVLTAPAAAIVAALVRLTSAGPVLFSQERLGRGGARFHIYKFRTMRADAEAILAHDPELRARHIAGGYKLGDAEDYRITPLGHVLRRLRLDELPQLYNVLRGDMSLVGPRPIVPAEAQRYASYIELMRVTRPGVTGLWQVSGETSADYPRREAIDREFVATRTLSGDLIILWRTLLLIAGAAARSSSPRRVEGEQHLHRRRTSLVEAGEKGGAIVLESVAVRDDRRQVDLPGCD
jgi:exopolysaccharide production protein ExoY